MENNTVYFCEGSKNRAFWWWIVDTKAMPITAIHPNGLLTTVLSMIRPSSI